MFVEKRVSTSMLKVSKFIFIFPCGIVQKQCTSNRILESTKKTIYKNGISSSRKKYSDYPQIESISIIKMGKRIICC